LIYVSSSCVNYSSIAESVENIYSQGYTCIELSGGTKFYPGLENDLLNLKQTFDLDFLCHNYFPPPKTDFVLNLASLNDEIYEKSMAHYRQAIELSRQLNATKFGLHAGFLLDLHVDELGNKVGKRDLFDRKEALKRFCEGYMRLHKGSEHVELYVENNVVTAQNRQTYEGISPFLLTCVDDYNEMRDLITFKLLLDVGHLKVSCNAFDLHFEQELSHLLKISDYIHISDNNGLADQNNVLELDSPMAKILAKNTFEGKTITLEIYEPFPVIKRSMATLKRVIGHG